MTDRALRHIVTTQVPGIDGTGITVAEKTQLVNDVSATKIAADILTFNRFDPADPQYGAVRGVVSTAQRAANTVAINQAAADALAANGTLVIKGTYECDGTVVCSSYMDAAAGRLEVFSQSAVALQIGGDAPYTGPIDKLMYLPAMIQRSKSWGGGWPGSDVGVRVSNAYHCKIFLQEIANFKRGVVVRANGTGNVYNDYHIGFLNNNSINFDVEAVNGGWVNQNVHYSGRFYIHTSEGLRTPGTRHIRIPRVEASSDNLTFIGSSLEGGPEYTVEYGGRYTTFENCRWEVQDEIGPRILAVAGAATLTVDGGYFAERITVVGPLPQSQIRSGKQSRSTTTGVTSGMFVLNPTSPGAPAVAIMPGGTAETVWSDNPETKWRWRWSANRLQGKATDDAFPRVEISPTSGAIYMGDGTVAPTIVMQQSGSDLISFATGKKAYFDGTWQKPFHLGQMRLWNNSGTLYRKNGGDPISATDGTAIG